MRRPRRGLGFPLRGGGRGWGPRPGWQADRGESSVFVALAVLVAGAAVVVGATLRQNRLDEAALRAYTARLDVEAANSVAGQPYRYLATNSDASPVHWNTCAPIHYVVNLTDAPLGAGADVTEAVQRVSTATGLTFVYDGPTAELPDAGRRAYQPGRYGKRWAPLLLGWTPLRNTGIKHRADTVGVTVPYVAGRNEGDLTIVTGQIALEADRTLPAGFGMKGTWGAVLMHEFGHAIGLGHVSDPDQIMDGGNVPGPGPAEWGAGDLAGLRTVGRAAGCRRVPKPGR